MNLFPCNKHGHILFLQERVHDLLGTTGNTDTGEAGMVATGHSYKDFTLNGRSFSSSGLLPLPAWARNNNGTVVEGESEAGRSLTQTLDPLDTGRMQEAISGEIHKDVEGEEEDENDGVVDIDEENNDEGEVVVPKPLNDVSNVFFNNSLPSVNPIRDSSEAEHIAELPPHGTQSPQMPLRHSFNAQLPSVPLLAPDDSWVSNPSVPYFHRLSDIDASETFRHSINDTLATVTDAMITNEQEAVEPSEVNNSLMHGEENINTGATLENGDRELLETARSQKTPLSYHSDVDVEEDVKSEDETTMSNSKRRLDFNTEDSQHDSDGFLTHIAQDVVHDVEDSPRSPHTCTFEQDLLDAENPVRLKTISRTSLSPGSRSGSSRGSARKAAMCRREYEHHRHGADSSDEEDYRPVQQRLRSPESDGQPDTRTQKTKNPGYKRTASSTDTGGYRSDHSDESKDSVCSTKTSNVVNAECSRSV